MRGKPSIIGLLLGITLVGQVSFAATQYHRLIWDTDPSTKAIIGFSPNGTSTSPYVSYGYSTNEATWTTKAVNDSQVFDSSLTSHFVRLTNLTPNSAVYYRVCDQDGCGQRFWFKTAPTDNSPFVVVAGGDTRTGWDTRRAGNTLIAKTRPLFVMHGGDYTNANSAYEVGQFLTDWAMTFSSDTIDGFAYKRIYPLVTAHGNHEDGNYNTLCQVYGVDTNNDGSCSASDTYGAFNVSPLLRVYTLNSQFMNSGWSTYATTMNNWLANDLSTTGSNVTWRFVQYHKPMFPHTSSKSDNTILFSWWANNFYNYAVNLVVESDSHVAKVTKAVMPSGNTYAETTTGGTVYVGEGSWGAPARSADDPKSWTQDLASIQQFKVITVTPDHLEVRTAQFDASASTLTRLERENNTTLLPSNVNWWIVSGIGESMNLIPSAEKRSIIDDGSLANTAPVANFSFATNNLIADFTNSATDSDGSVVSWDWNFGDGATSTAQNPSHTYATAGSYTVTLTVTDNDGATNSKSQTVTVSTANIAPTADFTAATNNLTANFTDSSTDSDGSVNLWSWNFGDGATSTAQNPSHTYAVEGTYTVTLTVTDNDSATGSTSKSVSVTAPAAGSDPVSVQLTPSDDTFISSSKATSNYNGSSEGLLADGSDSTYGAPMTLIKFDLGAIPVCAVVESASVDIYVTNKSSGSYEMYSGVNAWTESTATFNSVGGTAQKGTLVSSVTPSSTGSKTFTFSSAGLTAVQNWIAGTNNGVIIASGGTTDGLDMSSKETGTAPVLNVTYNTNSCN